MKFHVSSADETETLIRAPARALRITVRGGTDKAVFSGRHGSQPIADYAAPGVSSPTAVLRGQ